MLKQTLALVGLTVSLSANAAMFNVLVEGVFATHSDPDNLLSLSLPAEGAVFSLSMTYESDTSNIYGYSPSSGAYVNAIRSMSLTVEGQSVELFDGNRILILNDAVLRGEGVAEYIDVWLATSNKYTPTEVEGQRIKEGFGFDLYNVSTSRPLSPLTSNALVPPSWGDEWSGGGIYYRIDMETRGPSANDIESTRLAIMTADITSITVSPVPVPAAAWLFGSALIGLAGIKRRK